MKHIIYNLTGLILLAVLLVMGLYWRAEQPYRIKNNFKRKHLDLLMQSLALRVPQELTGLTTDGIHTCYFHGMRPEKVWRMDLNHLKLDSLIIAWPHMELGNLPFKLIADQDHLYLHYPNKKEIWVRDLNKDSTDSFLINKLPYMLAFISRNKMVMTTTDTSNMQPVMLKQDLQQQNAAVKINFWPEQFTGIIPVDGALYYDVSITLLTYHYYRKNGFMVLDTNLTKVADGKTIDTVLKGNIKVRKINKTFTLAAPPTIVNGFGSADGGRLYISGGLKADNEGAKAFRNNTVIDVYDIRKARYLYSFYIPVFMERKTNGFVVRGDNLICLYGDYILVYKMRAVAG